MFGSGRTGSDMSSAGGRSRRGSAHAAILGRVPSFGAVILVVFSMCGLLASVGFAVAAKDARGVYLAEVQVRFLPPASSDNPNVLAISSSSLVITAGAVQKVVDDHSGPRVADASNTLASQGIRDGWAVSVPNTGGQWSNVFADPWLDVQAVGSTPAAVTSKATMLVARIDSVLSSMQQAAKVDRYNLITTQMSPESGPQLTYQGGSGKRAAAAALLLGVGVTTALTTLLRRRQRVVTASKPQLVPPPEPPLGRTQLVGGQVSA